MSSSIWYVQHKNDFLPKIGHLHGLIHGTSAKKWPKLSKKIFLSKVYHVKELIASPRKMFELLKLDLPN